MNRFEEMNQLLTIFCRAIDVLNKLNGTNEEFMRYKETAIQSYNRLSDIMWNEIGNSTIDFYNNRIDGKVSE